VATPPAESARLLGETEHRSRAVAIVSVHLLFDRPLLDAPLAALLGSDAHWVFDPGALTAISPRGAVPNRGVERVPELMESRP